jgi:hypothetical protein
MPRVEFYRVDLPVRIESLSEGKIRISIGSGAPRVLETEFQYAASALLGVFPEIGQDAFERDRPEPSYAAQRIDRIVLEIAGRELAADPWEEIFRFASRLLRHPSREVTWVPLWTVVRTCHVRPRFQSTPFTLPLRILQFNPHPAHPIGDWVRALFGSRPQFEIDRAVLTASSDIWQAPYSWPTVDILHIDYFQALSLSPASPENLLTTSRPTVAGTLGWFARWTERWQTRLLILNCWSPEMARDARTLAHALCEKGGPAVLVIEPNAGSDYRLYLFTSLMCL